jgi:O-antigen ligase
MRNVYPLFLAVLIFSPLAFGAVEPWSVAMMESLAIFSLCLYLHFSSKDESIVCREIPGLLPLFFFLGYILFQMIPMPAELIRLLSPKAYEIYSAAAAPDGRLAWAPLSVNLKSTFSEFLRFSSYAAFYILTVQILSQKKYLEKTLTMIFIFAALLAMFSMLQHFTSNGKIFWVRDIQTKFFFGPFANKNHFAGFMDMLFPVAVGLFLAIRPAVSYESLRVRISDMINQRDINNHILVGIGAVIMATSVFLTLSRGGIISLCLPLLFMAGVLFAKSGNRKSAHSILFLSLIIVLLVAWFGWGQVIDRFDELKDAASTVRLFTIDRPDRVEMWNDSLSLIKDFALTGSGMGSFVSAYPAYRAHWTDYAIDHAHGDYLEILAEGGIVGLVLAAWFMLAIFYSTYKTILLRRDDYSIYVYTGCITGLVSMLIFSITDFNLHIGSNGLYFFFLAGLAVSAANTRLHRGLEPTYLGQLSSAGKNGLRFIMPALLVICILFNLGVLAGEYSFLPVKDLKPAGSKDSTRMAELAANIERSSLFDPLEAKYYYAAGMIQRTLPGNNNSVGFFNKAVALNPMNGEYLQRLGLSLYEKGQTAAGDGLIVAGTLHDAANPARYKFCAIHFFSTGRKEAAAECIKKALVRAPDRTADFILLMMLRGMNDDEIRSTLPERTAPYLAFADYLAVAGKHAAAEKTYRDALLHAANEKKADRSYFIKASDYFAKRELFEDALWAVKQGIAKIPGDGLLHFTAGTLYEKLGMNTAAIEAYKKAVSLDITRTDAYKRMEDLIRKTGKP